MLANTRQLTKKVLKKFHELAQKLPEQITTQLFKPQENPSIVCAADDRYAMPLTVAVRSVLANLKSYPQVKLFLIDGGISPENKEKFLQSLNPEQIELHWLQPDQSKLTKMKVKGHVSLASYYRLLIPELLPGSLQKVIYLDSDLVVNADIGKLWNIDVGDYYLLAVQDLGVPYVGCPVGLLNYQELGYPADYKYFNAGVLVINLQKWREENIGKKVINYIQENLEFVRWWDQDGLNAVLAGKWGELDYKWNQQPPIYGYGEPSWKPSPLKKELSEEVCQDIIDNPYIVHYVTSRKPWRYDSLHPRRDLFFHYLDMTAWAGWRPEKPVKSK
ncbi:MAG: glycosyltransferase family 8 protein [Oscillatoria sp. PMC 1068.18]|nr:glycosyltransferase family 8 protein [Oscillatoria sp. PMC 1076.18]MEC4987577.1 glycosyltransferase family 8 protein [Oscillatoria sp. PMC 1068.18]